MGPGEGALSLALRQIADLKEARLWEGLHFVLLALIVPATAAGMSSVATQIGSLFKAVGTQLSTYISQERERRRPLADLEIRT